MIETIIIAGVPEADISAPRVIQADDVQHAVELETVPQPKAPADPEAAAE